MTDDGCLWCARDIERDTRDWPFCSLACREGWWLDAD